MDNLCHTLAGAALGEAGLKRRTAMGMATLMLASNLPDVDVAVFLTDTLAMSFRRGWTHGIVALAVLPAMFAGLMWAIDALARWRGKNQRPRASLSGLLLLAYVGTWLHVFMDWLNSYGVRLLKPFSDRWFYGDALYIVDPILYLIFAAGILLARMPRMQGQVMRLGSGHAYSARKEKQSVETGLSAGSTQGQVMHAGSGHAYSARWARLALATAGIYVLLMLASNWWARAEVRAELTRAGREDARFMVTPVFANPLRREVIVDTGDRYEKGDLWFAPTPHFRPAGYGVNVNRRDPAVRAILDIPRVRAFLMWSRFPFFVVERTTETRVFLNDYRYSGPSARDGWATQVFTVRE